MEGSARGANSAGAPHRSGDGQGDSPLAALSGIADRVRAAAGERLGPDAAERLRSVASGVSDPAGATVPAPPFEERPELYVGAAFAGGLMLAGVIRLLAR
jgi:hypothetical protein